MTNWNSHAVIVFRCLTLVIVVAAVAEFVIFFAPIFAAHPEWIGGDLKIYQHQTLAWLNGGSFYLDRQLHGPYELVVGDSLYPPTSLLLFLPFLVLPSLLFWLIPLAIVAYAFWRRPPAPWTWPLIAAVWLDWRPQLVVMFGNPSMWVVASVALGVLWGWPAVAVLLKPSLFPFALIGARRRSWWIAAAAAIVLSLPFAGLWLDWWHVVHDVRTSWLYSLADVPLMLTPFAMLTGRLRERTRDDQITAEPVARAPRSAALSEVSLRCLLRTVHRRAASSTAPSSSAPS